MSEQHHPYYGFTTQIESVRLRSLAPEKAQQYLENQLMSMLLHVSRNIAVSPKYSYWTDEQGGIFSDPEHTIPMIVDQRERGGFYNIGIHKAIDKAKKNPYHIQLLYSPPGPASFDEIPPVEYARPYQIGQLYLMWSNGTSIDNIALSMSQEAEPIVERLFGEEYIQSLPEKPIQRIIHWITNPINTGMNLLEFMQYLQEIIPPDTTLFQSNSSLGKRNYTIAQVSEEIHQSLNGTLGTDFQHHARTIAGKYIRGEVSPEDAYLTVFKIDGTMQGKTQWTLGGACGGTTINILDLEQITQSPAQQVLSQGSLASVYRHSVQLNSDNGYRDGKDVCVTCPYCQNQEGNRQLPDGTYLCGNPHCLSNRR